MPWRIEEHDGMFCLAKEDTGERVPGSCHKDRKETEDMMDAMYAKKDMMVSEKLFIENDNFAALKPGDPIRLFPYGKLTGKGKTREFTKELASRMKLPSYKPAIKLGSHADTTPAGGFIESLMVGDDGLYAVPAFTEKGAKALEDGDFRYHSPEVIWENGALEDVTKEGGWIQGPLIIGLAFLHDPALGAAAALYHIEHQHKEIDMTAEVLEQIKEENKSFLAKMGDFFSAKKQEAADVEKFAAVEAERNQYKADLEALNAKSAKETLRASVKGEFATDEFGAAFKELGTDEAADMLASMSEEQRGWVTTQLKALSAQIKESGLVAEKGKPGDETPAEGPAGVDAKVRAYMAEKNIKDYNKAAQALMAEQPDLYKEIK